MQSVKSRWPAARTAIASILQALAGELGASKRTCCCEDASRSTVKGIGTLFLQEQAGIHNDIQLSLWSTFDIRGGTTGAQAEEPAGNFTEEQFCFSSSFNPFNIQGRGVEVGRGELEAPHQTGEEALLLPEILFDLDGKESPLQATTAPTPAELELHPEILLDLDGRELPHKATTAPTDQSELEWEKLLSDPEFWSTFDIRGGTTGAQAEEPAGNFTEEQFCFSNWFDPFSNQGRGVEVGRGGGEELKAPHQTEEEALLLPEILFDLDGKESPLQATTAPTPAELEWLPEILLDLDGRELPHKPTTAPTDLAELEWEKLLSDPELWSTFDISGGTRGAQAPSELPKDDDDRAI
ncbi:hypothetical protein EJ110_NYTH08499 [Nymphaea thermarum]|nr:hypothetical protein EJ110_NYTH08499 [Nymphaea thermarum]